MRPTAFLLAVALAPGCGDGGDSGGAGSSTEGAGGGNPVDPSCIAPGHAQPAEAFALRAYSGRVVDQDGEPMVDAPAQACGVNVCLFGRTDAGGIVELEVDDDVSIEKARFKYGQGLRYAMFALPMRTSNRIDVGTQVTWRLPEIAASTPIAAGTSVSFGDVALGIAPETTIRIDRLTFETEAEQGFRAERIPLVDAPSVVDGSLGLELLYTTNPIDSTFCPRASLTVPNSLDWDPGTRIEILLHGTKIDEAWAPYGGWAPIAEAVVSEDGSSVVTTSDAGIPILGILGLRRLR